MLEFNMKDQKLTLSILPETFTICRLDRNAPVPDWATKGNFYSITRTQDELSILCDAKFVPENIKQDSGWRAFKLEGPIDLTSTGILASLVDPLSEANISILVVSSYDTDYILVRTKRFKQALEIYKEFCNVQE